MKAANESPLRWSVFCLNKITSLIQAIATKNLTAVPACPFIFAFSTWISPSVVLCCVIVTTDHELLSSGQNWQLQYKIQCYIARNSLWAAVQPF